MKKILLLVAILPLVLCAQVRIERPAKKARENIPYDSTTNYVKEENSRCLVGQKMQVLPLRESSRRYGYNDIAKGSNPPTLLSKKVEYNDLLGKVLTCTGSFVDDTFGSDRYYLELKDDSNGDIYCYHYPCYEGSFYFLVLGYKEKFEREYRGKTFVFKGASISIYDFNTGEKSVAEPQDKFVFQEMIFNSEKYKLGYLFTDEKSHLYCFDDFDIKLNLINKDKVDELISLYGERAVSAGLEGRYYVGMPVELLELSWGKPDTINSTSYNKQYVYKLSRGRIRCFYVENGKITAWN